MPIYDYLCLACGTQTEILQSFNVGYKRKCPKCGKLKLKRQVATGTLPVFKGPGFYATDYPKNKDVK